MVFCDNLGEGGSSSVQYHPQKPLDMPIERFFASLRFEQRGKLDQLGVEIGSFE
jgi:hypothetical protein